jgi:hypothetical protein
MNNKPILKHQEIIEMLKGVARGGKVIYYGEVASTAGLNLKGGWGRREVGKMLHQICQDEVSQGHPMLGSVVIRKDSRMPGKGYFQVAKETGLFKGNSDEDNYWSSH